jgi:hypothetical protein
VLKTNFLEDRDMNLPNTQAAMSDAADLVGTVVGTLESGKGVVTEVEGLITNSQIRSDISGLIQTAPAAATELIAAAKGGVITIITDAPEFIADATLAYAALLSAIAKSKGVTVVAVTSAQAPAAAAAITAAAKAS